MKTKNYKQYKIKKSKNDYSQTIDDIYEFLEDFNSERKRNMLIVFADMIEDVEGN